MDPTLLAILALVLGLGLGVFLGHRLGAAPVAEWKARHADSEAEWKERYAEVEAESLNYSERLARMAPELATMSERAARADVLAASLDETRTEREGLRAELATLKEKTANFDEQKRLLVSAREELLKEFQNTGHAVLTKAQEALMERAAERLGHSERASEEKLKALLEGAGAQFSALNKESLAEIDKKVGPVGETLERYRKRVEELEKNRVEAYHQLQGVIGEVKAGQREVIDGANRITTTLRGATKARGDWGELQLANLLETCGLFDKSDFNFQSSVPGDTGNVLRPDAVINIPGGRRLVVDVKNVFNTYAQANEAENENEEERQALLKAHARELRKHIDELSSKRYQDYVDGSADFVVMFIPGEHVLYAALTQDHGLLDYALKRQIVLSSPLNFMSIALTVSTVWRQAGVQADAQEIARLGKELYDRLGVVAGHLGALRKSLYSTNQNFDRLVGSFDTNLRRTGERFEELSVDTSAQDLTEALPIGHQPRMLLNFSDAEDSAKIDERHDAAE